MVVFYGARLTDDHTEKYIPTAKLREFSFITGFIGAEEMRASKQESLVH